MNRQELMEKISDLTTEEIADFILKREREQLARIVEPLRKYKDQFSDIGWNVIPNKEQAKVMDKSLAIADEIMKG